nr:hypothetical protein Hi04_10k_c361_00023 [uncultured bacterium]
MQETDGCDYFVRRALEVFEHPVGFFKIAWLAEKFFAQTYDRVGAENQSVGKFFRDGSRLAIRIDLRDFLSGKFAVKNFLNVAPDNLEIVTQLPKQFRPSRRH